MSRVAAIQMCSSHLVEENLLVAAKFIKEAAKNKAQLVVLPEMFAIISENKTEKLQAKEQLGVGKIQSFIADLAKQNRIWIVAGTIPIEGEDKTKAKATSLVFNDQGEVVARYDKIHLFDVTISDTESYKESAAIEAGNKIVTVDTPVGKLGLAVCYDIRFPALFRELFKQGAELFALPAAFTVKTGEAHWEVLARARAIENFCYLIGAAQGGTHSQGRKTYGHSLIIDPWGSVVACKTTQTPGVIYADIDLQKIDEIRSAIPVGLHHKLD